MTQGFDEWFKKRHTKSGWYEKTLLNDDDALYLKKEMSKAYKAGASSRQDEVSKLQTEIDELKKRIKAMQKTAQRIMVAIDDDELDYARRSAIKIFKGEE